jgi:hypothetical protein
MLLGLQQMMPNSMLETNSLGSFVSVKEKKDFIKLIQERRFKMMQLSTK